MRDRSKKKKTSQIIADILTVVSIVCLAGGALILAKHRYDAYVSSNQNAALRAMVSASQRQAMQAKDGDKDAAASVSEDTFDPEDIVPVILPEYETLYETNNDVVGWLHIDDTVIDYPVLQTPGDEEFYLHHDFYGKKNANGCLIMDTDSRAGKGTAEYSYAGGEKPSGNIIIHGHHLIVKEMFADLAKYDNKEYGEAHSRICFDSLYEKREYELISAFYSKVLNKGQTGFRYYAFFNADSEQEFNEFYKNIKELSIYDTGVTAEYGDEFLTLSTCAYHTNNGRFVVIAKRVK